MQLVSCVLKQVNWDWMRLVLNEWPIFMRETALYNKKRCMMRRNCLWFRRPSMNIPQQPYFGSFPFRFPLDQTEREKESERNAISYFGSKYEDFDFVHSVIPFSFHSRMNGWVALFKTHGTSGVFSRLSMFVYEFAVTVNVRCQCQSVCCWNNLSKNRKIELIWRKLSRIQCWLQN